MYGVGPTKQYEYYHNNHNNNSIKLITVNGSGVSMNKERATELVNDLLSAQRLVDMWRYSYSMALQVSTGVDDPYIDGLSATLSSYRHKRDLIRKQIVDELSK